MAAGAAPATAAEPGAPVRVMAATAAAPLGAVPEPPAREHLPPRLRLLRYEPEPGDPAVPRRTPAPARRPHLVLAAPAGPSEDLRRRVGGVLRLALEVLDGRRPLTQLAPHLAPSVLRYLRAALARRPPTREPSRMTSLHVCRPHADVAEVAVVYRRGPRARALAARFERARPASTRGRTAQAAGAPQWRCVTLRLL